MWRPADSCALHIPKYALDQRKVSFARIMHEEAHLLHSVRQVGARLRYMPGSAMGAPSVAELGTRVNRCRCRVTLGHARLLKKIHRVLPLAKEEPVGGASHGDPQEVMELPKVRHGEFRVKAIDDAAEESIRGSREDDVVDVEQQVGTGAALSVDKEGGVSGRSDEAELSNVRGEALVPRPRGLLEAVEGALKKTNGIGARRVDEAGGLLTIDGLVQVTVKKGILHVQLVDRPLTRSSDAEDDPNRCRLDDGAERLVIVDAVSLGEAADDPASLMTSQRAVGVELMPEDPFASDNIGARRLGDEAPCVVVDESLVLLSHSRAPLRVGKGPSVVTGNGRGSRGGSDMSSWWEAIMINMLQ
jgi:hypothetical protein